MFKAILILSAAGVAAMAASPVRAACPYGPQQCMPGFVWRDAFANDHACVTGAQRSQAAADNSQARGRVLPNGYCRAGWVWREADARDHVCVTGATRAAVALQNREAASHVDPACSDPSAGIDVTTEYQRQPSGQIVGKPSRAYTQLLPDGSVVGISQGPLAATTDLMWAPGAVITASVTGASDALKARIQRYASEWSKWGNVRLEFVNDPMQAQVRAEVNNDKTSWSYVGRDALAKAAPEKTMNLGWLTDGTSDDEVSRVVQHEFGHAFGLIHEHQSPAAGIPWDRDKVFAYYRKAQDWTDEQIQQNILDQAAAASTNFSQFDPSSIMEYPIDGSLTTNGYSVGWNRTLSAIDKQYFATFYPYPPGARGAIYTGDDCDTVAFDLANGVPDQSGVRFILRLGAGLTWWKSIGIPTLGGGYIDIEAHDALSGEAVVAMDQIDTNRPLRFAKAKFFGVHTPLGYTWPMLAAIADGSRLTLDWNRDSCR